MKLTITFATLLLLGLLLSSASYRAQPAANDASELTLLMREMYADAQRMKQQLLKGKQPKVRQHFDAIHTAKATVPSKNENDRFRAAAKAYQATLVALEQANATDAPARYQDMIQSCMNCHATVCPGPMTRIQRLYLPPR
jgi:hypothetical protein